MMHDRPSDPEYCQGIYDAAKQVVDYCHNNYGDADIRLSWEKLEVLVANLKRALEGKG